jgi:hypothetical protein
MRALLLLVTAGSLLAAPRVVYTKIFPGSVPAYVSISVERDGSAEYKEAVDDDLPLRFKLSAAEADAIFGLAEKLNFFNRPLESGLNVAKMGEKTFRWEDGAKKQEVKFNYSTDVGAQELHDWFEKITETEGNLIILERTIKFDRLGVNRAILQLQACYERKRLIAPDQFLKLLDRIVKNEAFLNMARERAANLAEVFRNPPPAPEHK